MRIKKQLFWTLVLLIFSTLTTVSLAVYETREQRAHKKSVLEAQGASEYGPWIVRTAHHLDSDTLHQRARSVHESYRLNPKVHSASVVEKGFEMKHVYEHTFHGVAVSGILKDDLLGIYGVDDVVPDGIKFAALSWGVDRLDQTANFPSSSYSPTYHGAGNDIYILDSGIDTNHNEFSTNSYTRTVSNIFNGYGSVTADDDGYGHGTHVAGIAGGNTEGVSPAASIYGLKVLADDGSGSDTIIIAGIEYVMANLDSNRGIIINLSLGGTCANTNCSTDPLVLAVESAVSAGIVVVVAAGNEYCNSANPRVGSPASAQNAITVAASTKQGKLAIYSNYGQHIDMIAPGHSVEAACAFAECGDEATIIKYSGTSMAAPHVAGVAAQLLEKSSSATPAQVLKAMQCDAQSGAIVVPVQDTITLNIFLQVPANDGSFGTCTLGTGCTDTCNSNGYCAPAHENIAHGSTANTCFCDSYYGGPTCGVSENQQHDYNCQNGMAVTMSMDAADREYIL